MKHLNFNVEIHFSSWLKKRMGCNGVGKRDVKTLEEVEEEGEDILGGLSGRPDIFTCKNTKYTTGTCNAMPINVEETEISTHHPADSLED